MPRFQLAGADLGYNGSIVLNNVSLSIADGERVALVGPSGAGKSTLLNHLYQHSPNSIALCPQNTGLVDLLSAYHNIYMGGLDRFGQLASLWNLIRPLATARQQIEHLAIELGLEAQLWQSVDRLSGGQRQRVALGRALYRQQATFLGDEPVSALDPQQARALLAMVLQRHRTAVVCMHNPELTLSLFDRVIAVRDGGICLDQPASALSIQDLQQIYLQPDRQERQTVSIPDAAS